MKFFTKLWKTHGKKISDRLTSGLSDLKKVAIGASKEGIFTNRRSQEKIQEEAEKAKRRNSTLSDEEANKLAKGKLNRQKFVSIAEAISDASQEGADTTQILNEAIGDLTPAKEPIIGQLLGRFEKATEDSDEVINATASDVRSVVEDLMKKTVDSVFGTRQSTQESQSPSTDVSSTETDEQSETTKKKKTDGSVIGSMKEFIQNIPTRCKEYVDSFKKSTRKVIDNHTKARKVASFFDNPAAYLADKINENNDKRNDSSNSILYKFFLLLKGFVLNVAKIVCSWLFGSDSSDTVEVIPPKTAPVSSNAFAPASSAKPSTPTDGLEQKVTQEQTPTVTTP